MGCSQRRARQGQGLGSYFLDPGPVAVLPLSRLREIRGGRNHGMSLRLCIFHSVKHSSLHTEHCLWNGLLWRMALPIGFLRGPSSFLTKSILYSKARLTFIINNSEYVLPILKTFRGSLVHTVHHIQSLADMHTRASLVSHRPPLNTLCLLRSTCIVP